MGVSTVAVAIGILGEYVAHFVFEKEARRNKLEMAISILFGVLVLGGVVGEWIFGSKLSQASEHLQQIADVEVAQFGQVAASAQKEAAEARQQAESFHLQIAEANERAANAERETARIQHRLADRKLTDEQLVAIAGRIKPFAGQEFDVTPYWDSKESVAIANRILKGLTLGGWKYVRPEKAGFMLGGQIGVFVHVHPNVDKKIRDAANTLVAILNAQGIVAEIREQNLANPLDTKLHLTVGAKP